ncbi:MAG: ABC transporter substrate-binding protein [bacterium]|nr:ABC transporter substrate-binding protein [bacterium]
MILVGIDDTDTADSRGTNQLAKAIVRSLADRYRCIRIVRHQLFFDPRVPYTSKNGSASIALEPLANADPALLAEEFRSLMLADFIVGSDPGLCVCVDVSEDVSAFGQLAKSSLVTQQQAHEIAQRCGIYLAGLGGSCDGVIGALAAIGLAATGNDGRVVQLGDSFDELSGVQSVETLRQHNVLVCRYEDGFQIEEGVVDVGKKLRPNRFEDQNVLFVAEPASDSPAPFVALKLP